MRTALLAGALLGLAATPVAAERSAEQAVRAFVAAYNNRDFAAMEMLLHADAGWLAVDGDKVAVEAQGRDALIAGNRRYLTRSCPSCRSELDGVASTERFVTTVERARWTRRDGSRAEQSGVGVYEVKDGRILNVWYFPVDKAVPR